MQGLGLDGSKLEVYHDEGLVVGVLVTSTPPKLGPKYGCMICTGSCFGCWGYQKTLLLGYC